MQLPQKIKQAQARSKPPIASWMGYVLIACALLLYLRTLDNGLQPGELVGGDLITHQYAQVQARPSNAPGYPLYTMGGWLWFHSLRTLAQAFGDALPNPVPLLSSYSTFWALLALWLFYRILCHLTRSPQSPPGDWPLAWLLCAFYAVTYFFWYYATTTEQYSSAVAQTLGIVYLYLLWADQKTMPASPRARRLLMLLAFLCGLALAHMLTVAFIVPPLVLVVLWQAPDLLRSPRMILGTVLAAMAPLLSYGYVYWRGALHPEWWGAGNWSTAQAWFWAFLSTAQGREELSRGFAPGRAFWGGGFPELIWRELSVPLLLLGLVGIARLERKLASLLYATLILYGIFCWGYRYGNWFQVILPAYPLLLLGVAALVHEWQQKVEGRTELGTKILPQLGTRYLPLALLVIAVFWRAYSSWPAANSHNRPGDTALDQAALLIAQPLPKGAALFAAVGDALALQYLIDIWQIRPDLQVVSSEQAAHWLAQSQPVFATWQAAPTLRAELPVALATSMQSAGPDWIVFQTNGQRLDQSPQIVLDRRITPEISLAGYRIMATPDPAPVTKTNNASMDVTLFWRIHDSEWPTGLSISVRPTLQGALLTNPAGGVIQEDVVRPARGLLTLANWPADQPVADAYRLPLPARLPQGANGVMVILYRSKGTGFENVAEINLSVSPP